MQRGGPQPVKWKGIAVHIRTLLEIDVPSERLDVHHGGVGGLLEVQEEGGRGLFLVAALSTRWDWYLTQEPAGKVVWCEIEALSPAWRGVGEGAGTTVRSSR